MKRLALLIAALTPLAHADVTAYNNLGPGDTYDPGSGWAIFGPQTAFPFAQAFQFTAQASGGITRLTIPIWHDSGPNLYRYEIYSDAAGAPGASLGVIGTTAGSLVDGPPWPPPVSITAPGTLSLVNGAKYWLVGFDDETTSGSWHVNIAHTTGRRAYTRYDGFWQTLDSELAAFKIEVAPTPCYANCDQSTAAPTLNANDFQCFLNLYAAGSAGANCDGSTAAPILNANDFQCFVNKFAVGCL